MPNLLLPLLLLLLSLLLLLLRIRTYHSWRLSVRHRVPAVFGFGERPLYCGVDAIDVHAVE